MKTDYKFWYITRDDSGFITECAVRFHEGDISTLSETDALLGSRLVTRYRRNAQLQKTDLSYLSKPDSEFVKDSQQKDAVIYTQKDFGQIKDQKDLEIFMNKKIAQDPLRTVIDEQK